MKKNNVFVTGFSSITSLGTGNEITLENLGKEISPVYFPENSERYRYPYFKIDDSLKKTEGTIRNSDIVLQMISSIKDKISAFSNIPVFLATSTGGIRETEEVYDKLNVPGFSYPLNERHFFDRTVKDIKEAYPGIFSDFYTFSTACSSSGHSIYQAFRFIKNGLIDRAVVIGVDSLALITMIGFDSLKLVSHTGTKPLSKDRDGLSLGEGGGILFLESEPKNTPFCEIAGCASNSDAYHISSPDPEGTSQKECISKALNEAGIDAKEVDYVNAHGTGTLMNDEIEMKAIDSFFSHDIKVTSLKSFIGHTLGASAVSEIAITQLMLKKKKIYQPRDFRNPISRSVPEKTIDADINFYLKNSFGFGGNNVSIILKNMI